MKIKSKNFRLASIGLSLLVIAFAFVSCNSTGVNGEREILVKYDLKNVREFQESPLQVSYEIIPLQVPRYNRIRIFLNNLELFEGKLYISTLRESIMIFSKDGEFINKIEPGEEEEYQVKSLNDFMIDREKRQIVVLDGDRIVNYDLYGNYINSIESKTAATEIGVMGDHRVLLRHKNSLNDYTFALLANGEVRDFEVRTGQTTRSVLNPKHFHHYNNKLYFTGYANNVYSLTADSNIPQVVASVRSMNSSVNVKGLDSEQYTQLCHSKKHFTYINNFFVYDDNMWGFSLFVGDAGHKLFMDLESNRYYYHPLATIPYSQNNRWVEDATEYYLFPPSAFSDNTAEIIAKDAPELYRVMEAAVDLEAKMWVIKAKYSRK